MFYCPSATSGLDQVLVDDGTVTKMEVMFQKPLTPSDVGKLNRLVIPKQFAEKYFPPTGAASGAGGGEKGGLLLSFEDEGGKCWRFRYSYWNSSQSYVLTKGWSRFIKEKQLHAGDLVLFARGAGGRLFIGLQRHHKDQVGGAASQPAAGYTLCIPDHPDAGDHQNVQNHLQGGRCKILRLFGVDMECQPDDDDEFEFIAAARDCSSTSSYGQDLTSHPTSNYMETTFSGSDEIQD